MEVHKEKYIFVRSYSFMLCGRFSYFSLLAIVARGAERLPRVPLPAALHFDLPTRQPPTIEMEDLQMTMLNLRDVYPFYHSDLFVEVSQDIAEAMTTAARRESNARRQMYRYKAQYSLDRGDGIEHSSLRFAPSPAELYEEKEEIEALYAALAALPEKQGRRVYAHYILGVSKAELARAEGVSLNVICVAITRGLESMKKYLKNAL